MKLSTLISILSIIFATTQASAWTSKETWLTRLSKPEIKKMLGLREDVPRDVDFVVPPSLTLENLPSSLDWRNKDGKNWVSPILNQGACGSCVAFAAIGVMETQMNISSLLPNLNLRLAPQHLFACGRGGCEYGWQPENAASYLMRKGVTDEACMPYISGATGKDVACQATCADISQRTYKIANYSAPTRWAQDIDAVKRALQKGPVMTTLSVYSDFISYSGGVYKHMSGEYLGGHAISIVGYDDATQSFIIRNSWGEEWGEQGFGHVAYSDTSGVGNSTWAFEVPSMSGGTVNLISPRDYTYISGQFPFTAESSYNNTDSLSFTVIDTNNKALWTSSCQSGSCVANLDTQTLQDGRYEVQVTAMNAHGNILGTSTKQLFYVANQKPSLSLSFTGNKLDMTAPFKGRVEFAVSASSSTVPMSDLEFHFKDANGKDHVRTSKVVLNQMVVGWRTNVVPNGTYEIWMVGRVKSNTMDISVESQHYTVTLEN